jgi:ligand-binding SRPBCC domain-containing protein
VNLTPPSSSVIWKENQVRDDFTIMNTLKDRITTIPSVSRITWSLGEELDGHNESAHFIDALSKNLTVFLVKLNSTKCSYILDTQS